MKRRRIYKQGRLISLISFCIITFRLDAQLLTVKALLDTNEITIGDQVRFHIEVEKDKDAVVKFPEFNDKLTDEVEIVSKSPIDSSWSKENKKVILSQNLLVTAFDSGLYYIPPIKMAFRNESITDTINSAPTYLEVHAFPIDTTGTIRDIKAIDKAPLGMSELYPYILLTVFVGLLTWFLIYYYKRKKRNEPVFKRIKPEEPAHILALRQLDKLKAEKLWQRGEVKLYYSRLTETLRTYIEKRFEIMAMEQTTDEIIVEFEGQELIDYDDLELLKKVLQEADLVKFAKGDPQPDENELNIEKAYTFVNNTKYSLQLTESENINIIEDITV